MKKTTLYLPDDLRQGLRNLARRTGRSQAELIREATRRLVDEQRVPGGFIGIASNEDFRAEDDESVLSAEWQGETRHPSR